jgi:uncharacterized membrane protein
MVSVLNTCLISFGLVSTDSINLEEIFKLECLKLMTLTVLSGKRFTGKYTYYYSGAFVAVGVDTVINSILFVSKLFFINVPYEPHNTE